MNTLSFANGFREVPVPRGLPIEPGSRIYQKDVSDGHLTVIVSRHPKAKLWHLSISHRLSLLDPKTERPLPGRYPTWDEIKEARYSLLPDSAQMAMILPPKAEYVNVHPTTFHLYEVPELEGRER